MPNDPLTFEQAVSELERILRDLEDGNTTLEEALARYERGVGLLRHCYRQLQNAEQKIQQLTGISEEGKPLLRPFEHISAVERVQRQPGSDYDRGQPGNSG
jgi:exodeoxyribonuclease VII small subunit